MADPSRAPRHPQGRRRGDDRRRRIGAACVRAGRRVWPRGRLAGTARHQLLCRNAVLRPGQPADDEFLRHATAAVLRQQSRARRGVCSRRSAGRRPGRLDGARRDYRGRPHGVAVGRFVQDAGASTAPVQTRHVVQHAALRRRQSADAARCLRWQPQRRNGLRRRHVRDQQGPDALVRRPLRPVPITSNIARSSARASR